MKFKTTYIYPIVIVLVFIGVIIFSTDGSEEKVSITGEMGQGDRQMPQDSIHQNLGSGMGGSSMGGLSDEYLNRINMLRNSVRENPNDTAAMRQFADFLSASHKPDSAIMYYERILEKDIGRTDIMLGLTAVYYSKDNLQKAKEYTELILDKNRNNIQAKFNLAAIEASMGNETKAKTLWQLVIEEKPNSRAADLAKDALNKMEKKN